MCVREREIEREEGGRERRDGGREREERERDKWTLTFINFVCLQTTKVCKNTR